MRDLDETDMEILSLLAENARRSFSAIGEEVGLSGPAVSDRVTAPRDGIINHFTINVDRSRLRAGVPILVKLDLPSESFDAVRERVRNDDAVEFALTCAECSNTVDSEGETSRVGGELYHFCCPSCQSRFEERHQRLEEGM